VLNTCQHSPGLCGVQTTVPLHVGQELIADVGAFVPKEICVGVISFYYPTD
jgi:hypothetical protein